MRSWTMHRAILIAGLASLAALPSVALAQGRVQAPATPPPVKPGIQKPNLDPNSQGFSALSLKLDALRQSLGRQVVVLHFDPIDINSWPDAQNSWPANNQRAEDMCKAGLGDRYGRVVSREARPIGGRWYFPNLVCETKP